MISDLSLTAGMLIVFVLSGLLAIAFIRLKNTLLRRGALLLVPLILSYSLYYFPVWLGSDPSEYSPWAFICTGAFTISGWIATFLVVRLGKRFNR